MKYAKLSFIRLMSLVNLKDLYVDLEWKSRIWFFIFSPLLCIAWLTVLIIACGSFIYDLIEK